MPNLSKKTIEILILLTVLLMIGFGVYLLAREPVPSVFPETSPSENMKTIRSNDDLNQTAKELDETNIDATIDLQLDQMEQNGNE